MYSVWNVPPDKWAKIQVKQLTEAEKDRIRDLLAEKLASRIKPDYQRPYINPEVLSRRLD